MWGAHSHQSLDFGEAAALGLEMRLSSRKLPMRDGGPRLSDSTLLPGQVVIQAHQEQLDEMAELGFKGVRPDCSAGSYCKWFLAGASRAVGT